MRNNKVRVALYITVIVAAATTLHEPWMIAVQAAMGGFALGSTFEEWFTKRVTVDS